MSKSSELVREFAWTGERYIPFLRGGVELEHLHRYVFACELVSQKDVLDIACGEGYGSHLLAASARTVIGVDLSDDVIQHARMKYVTPGLEFRQGDCTCIPLDDESVDVVISFETIEHHDKHEAMLSEIKRVLRPDGLLVISTPERCFMNELSDQRNEFHVKELSLLEFTELLARYFKNSAFFGQRVRYGSLMTPMVSVAESSVFSFHEGRATSITSHFSDPRPLFIVALASKCELPMPGASFFDGTDFLHQEMSSWQADRDGWAREAVRVKATLSWKITKPLRFVWNTLLRHLPARTRLW